MKTFTLWVKTTAILQFLTAAAHSLSFFVSPKPQNETEQQLFDLMAQYKPDYGAGIHRSTDEIITGLSACLPLLYVLGGLLLLYLVKRVGTDVMKGILHINLLVYGVAFVVTTIFTFLPPIVMTGLVFVSLIAARMTLPKT